MRMAQRYRGALLGLAAGDAVGTTVEFYAAGSFEPVLDMTGGGPFNLKPGEWTDDTSMMLCLADSLIERGGFDASDQMVRYLRWWMNGYLSSNGICFDIGNTVKAALHKFRSTHEPFAGSTDPNTAGNGSLMRLAPVPMVFAGHAATAVDMAALSSRTTHGAPVAVDACRYFAGLLVGALKGISKSRLLSSMYCPAVGCFEKQPLCEPIEAIARGSFKKLNPPDIKGTGYAAHCLEAALWAFYNSRTFKEGCLLAVNLGDDADTTAAVYGQLAGAHYGVEGIPEQWRARVAKHELIESYADKLLALQRGCPRRAC